jgi:hypothetical protein
MEADPDVPLEGHGGQQPKRRPKTSISSLLGRRRKSLNALTAQEEGLEGALLAGEGREIVEALIEISAGPPVTTQPVRPKSVSTFRASSINPATLSNMGIEFPTKEKIDSWKDASKLLKRDELRQRNSSEEYSNKVEAIYLKTPDGKLGSSIKSDEIVAASHRSSDQRRPPSRTAFTISSVQLIADPDWNNNVSPSHAHPGSTHSSTPSRRSRALLRSSFDAPISQTVSWQVYSLRNIRILTCRNPHTAGRTI